MPAGLQSVLLMPSLKEDEIHQFSVLSIWHFSSPHSLFINPYIFPWLEQKVTLSIGADLLRRRDAAYPAWPWGHPATWIQLLNRPDSVLAGVVWDNLHPRRAQRRVLGGVWGCLYPSGSAVRAQAPVSLAVKNQGKNTYVQINRFR